MTKVVPYQCTFVSEDGHRCEERKFVELDHIQAVACGGEATETNLRLLCRAHNQYEAECTFGAEFMRHKRIAAAEARAETKARVKSAREQEAEEEAVAAEQAKEDDVIPWLRALGFRADEARRAAEFCEDIPDASLEERVRRALSFVHVRGRVVRVGESNGAGVGAGR